MQLPGHHASDAAGILIVVSPCLRVIISGFIKDYLSESVFLDGESAERKRSCLPNLRIEH